MYTLTPARLVKDPLSDLLSYISGKLIEVDLDDDRFFGGLVRGESGPVLAMPPGRPVWERDTVARMLIGRWAGVPMAPLPAGIEMTELGG